MERRESMAEHLVDLADGDPRLEEDLLDALARQAGPAHQVQAVGFEDVDGCGWTCRCGENVGEYATLAEARVAAAAHQLSPQFAQDIEDTTESPEQGRDIVLLKADAAAAADPAAWRWYTSTAPGQD